MPRLSALTALAAAFSFSSVSALQNMQCQDGPYPYCVHVQGDKAPSGGSWPTYIFLPGSGARGSADNAESLAQYDGMGKMISWYYSGQKTTQTTLAAEQFLTIIPIAPDGSRHFDPDKVLAILDEVKANHKVDATRVTVGGYSMGSRGSWRFAVHHPEVLAAVTPSAGPAEPEGFDTLSQEYATPTFNLLKNVVKIPIEQFAGSSDETAGTTEPQKTQDEIRRLGGKLSTLTILQGATHADMSTKPWSDTDMLSWVLKQKRSGGTSTKKPSSVKPSSTKKPATKASSVPVAAVADVDTTEEDCEEDDTSAVDDEEDCEDEDASDGDDDEEDCEDDADDTDEEDCEEEVTVTKRSVEPDMRLPAAAAARIFAARQEHNFIIPRSRLSLSPLSTRSPGHRRSLHGHRMVPIARRRS